MEFVNFLLAHEYIFQSCWYKTNPLFKEGSKMHLKETIQKSEKTYL